MHGLMREGRFKPALYSTPFPRRGTEGPLVGEGISGGIEGLAAVESDNAAGARHPVGPRVGHGNMAGGRPSSSW